MFDFDAKMVAYMKAARTMSQEEVDEAASARAQFSPSAQDRYEAHSHHVETFASEH